ncbi:MAG: O-antigen polysaccharide polymerase Wzy [Flavobacteriales bacterium]
MLRLFTNAITLLILLYLYFYTNIEMNKVYLSFVLAIVCIPILMFYSSNYIRKKLFVLSSVFVFGMCIVHFQAIFQYIFEIPFVSTFNVWVNTRIVAKSVVLSGIGITSFLMGHEFRKLLPNKQSVKQKKNSFNNLPTHYFAILTFIFFLIFLFTANPLYLAGYYGGVSLGTTATYFQLLVNIMFNVIFIAKFLKLKSSGKHISFVRYIKSFDIVTKLICVFYILTMLWIGDRGPIISILLLLIGVYSFNNPKWVKPGIAISFVFIGIVSMSIIGKLRSTDPELSITERLSDVFNSESNSLNNTQELAGSIRTLHYAVDAVPEKHDYMYGRFQIQQIVTAVPGVGQFMNRFIDDRFQYKGSASFITYLDQGERPSYGLGTSIIADLYIDLGLVGVVFGLFFFGIISNLFEQILMAKNMTSLLLIIFAIVYFSKAIYLGRSTVLLPFKEALWTYVAFRIFNHINNK